MSNSSESSDNEYSMWSRPFTLGTRQVRVEEEWGLGIGGTIWEGGVLLANYISSDAFDSQPFLGKRCLELGAGVSGLPSLAAAHLNAFKEIVVTDIEECMEALAENLSNNLPHGTFIAHAARNSDKPDPASSSNEAASDGWNVPQSVIDTAVQELPVKLHISSLHNVPSQEDTAAPPQPSNQCGASSRHQTEAGGMSPPADMISENQKDHEADAQLTEEAGASSREQCQSIVTARKLDWTGDVQSFHPPIDLLLVADVVYIAELMKPLLDCMYSLSSRQTTVLFAYYERSATAGKVFWDLLPQYFSHEKIPENTYGAQPHPDNLGLFKLHQVPRYSANYVK